MATFAPQWGEPLSMKTNLEAKTMVQSKCKVKTPQASTPHNQNNDLKTQRSTLVFP